MTSYLGSFAFTSGASSTNLTLLVNSTFPAKLCRVEVWSQGIIFSTLNHYTGASLSGGSAITPLPMRGGAPPATETIKSGATVSGSKTVITGLASGGASTQYIGTIASTSYTPGNAAYSTPFDYIIPAGSAVGLILNTFGTSNLSVIAVIYWEEVRPQWSV